jgi:hypothetical protein
MAARIGMLPVLLHMTTLHTMLNRGYRKQGPLLCQSSVNHKNNKLWSVPCVTKGLVCVCVCGCGDEPINCGLDIWATCCQTYSLLMGTDKWNGLRIKIISEVSSYLQNIAVFSILHISPNFGEKWVTDCGISAVVLTFTLKSREMREGMPTSGLCRLV